LPILQKNIVKVGFKEHMSIGLPPDKPNKQCMQEVFTFQNRIKIKNELYATRADFTGTNLTHPFYFEYKNASLANVRYSSHQFTVPSYVMGSQVKADSSTTLRQALDFRTLQ
jgi:hypothetical protein